MLIPNAENAIVDIRKLRNYCLNLEHDDGKHKRMSEKPRCSVEGEKALIP